MSIFKKSILSLVLMILFSGCSFLNNLSTPKEPKIDINLPMVNFNSIKSISDITSIAFEWQTIDNPNIVGYNFYRSDLNTDGTRLKLIKTLENRYTNHFLDTKLEPNTKYAYQISALAKNGFESQTSNAYIVKTLPRIKAVSFIQAISNLPNRIKISWRPQEDKRVAYYKLERFDTSSNKWKHLKTLNGRLQSEYIDTKLKSSQTFKYRIFSYTFKDIKSQASSIVSATTKPLPIGVQNLQVSNNLAKKIEISWKPSPTKDVIKYAIYKSPFKLVGFRKVTEVSANKLNYIDIINKNGEDYYYKVFSIDKDGLVSSDIEPIRGTTLNNPAKPIITLAQIQDNKAILNWVAGDNRAKSYIVYKRIKENFFQSKTFKYNNITGLRFEDVDILPGVEYQYSIQAVDKNGIVSNKTDETTLIIPKRQ